MTFTGDVTYLRSFSLWSDESQTHKRELGLIRLTLLLTSPLTKDVEEVSEYGHRLCELR